MDSEVQWAAPWAAQYTCIYMYVLKRATQEIELPMVLTSLSIYIYIYIYIYMHCACRGDAVVRTRCEATRSEPNRNAEYAVQYMECVSVPCVGHQVCF